MIPKDCSAMPSGEHWWHDDRCDLCGARATNLDRPARGDYLNMILDAHTYDTKTEGDVTEHVISDGQGRTVRRWTTRSDRMAGNEEYVVKNAAAQLVERGIRERIEELDQQARARPSWPVVAAATALLSTVEHTRPDGAPPVKLAEVAGPHPL